MEQRNVTRLKNMREILRSDLVFEDICTALLQEELISGEEYQRIKNKVTDPEKIDILIDILPGKGPESFTKFVNILEKDYRWLATNLQTAEEKIEMNNERPTSTQNLNIGITREMMAVVRRNHRVIKGWTGLAHMLGLTHRIHNIRTRVNIYCEEADVCVIYLLEDWIGHSPKEATLGGLLYALREEGYNDCADELEAKFG
ncbi:uncharacterized protein [Periplaneta americana]|uniref:uncharacterized protein n=1 Tax=Periplaneta americana TaxID=6978 RepID=UPI0037E9B4C8